MASTLPNSPFDLTNDVAYRAWREAKLTDYPTAAAQLVVAVRDPLQLTDEERAALLGRVRKCNMVIYATPLGDNPDKEIPRRLAEQLGLMHLDSNLLADDDGITSITVNPEGDHPHYIPYTNRAINWHCDGYYNTAEQQIRGMLLHCVHNAAQGGENQLLDHEMVYLLLRDENPAYIRALMADDVMTIPPGKDGEGDARGPSVGPVFSIQPNGALHMRYTARKRNIEWKNDPATQAALARLEALLASDSPYIFRALLKPGMGLICNNVLHTRDGFTDLPGQPRRLIYRARYFDRIAST
ncbi:MAG TPA: TauD/TfdA family dioxygenase [Gammaproteobacteria bacterium]